MCAGTRGTCLGGGAGTAGVIQRGRRPCGLARLAFGRTIQRSPHPWIARTFPKRQRSDRLLRCLMLQVEYAYSDNSLDPGEWLLHCLRVRNDPFQLCRSLWSCQPHLSTVHCHCATALDWEAREELEDKQEATMGHTWFLCSRTGRDGNSDSWACSLHPGAPV